MSVEIESVPGADRAEYAGRLERVRAAMRSSGLEGLIVADDTQGYLDGNARYLSNFSVRGCPAAGTCAAVVVPAERDPSLIVPGAWLGGQFGLARRRSFVDQVPEAEYALDSLYEARMAGRVTAALVEAGLANARIGVCGWFPGIDEVFSALPDASFAPADGLLRPLRAQKSDWELHRLEKAREAAGDSVGAMTAAAVPGSSPARAVAEAKYVATVAGCEEVIVFVAGYPWYINEDAPRRPFEAGELISYEINTCFEGYWVQVVGSFAVGEPTALHERLLEAAAGAYEAMRVACAPGATGGELWDVGLEVVRSAGLEAWGQFGHGVGLAFADTPRVWMGETGALSERSCFVLHPAVADLASRQVAMVGEVMKIDGGRAVPLLDLAAPGA
jgi:Xaa-Pro aminopeptidase